MQLFSKPVRWETLRVLAAIGVLQLALCAAPAQGQAPDNGGLSSQSNAPVQITPAPSNPSSNSPPWSRSFPNRAHPLRRRPRSPRYATPTGPSSGAGLGYGPIRPGDIVEVQVFDAPEYSVSMPVSPAGEIAIPYAGLFHIEGMTSIEAAHAIARLFVQQQILRDPRVIVTTQQFGYSVTVMGEVKSPGIYTLAGKKRLIDMLTEAGGVTDRAGHVIEIFPSGSMKNPQTVLWDPTLRENDNAELEIKTGETILVSRCGVVYVGGNVDQAGSLSAVRLQPHHTLRSHCVGPGSQAFVLVATYSAAENLGEGRNAGGAKSQTRRRVARPGGRHHYAAGRHYLYSAERTQSGLEDSVDGRHRIRHAGIFLYQVSV